MRDEPTIEELREEYRRVFGEDTRSRHKRFLEKRIAWGRQAQVEGGLSERAKQRAAELANDANLRLLSPTPRTELHRFTASDSRTGPLPGEVLTREYKGRTLIVSVLVNGFEYEGKVYRSLTAIAKAVTGSAWNGHHFFGRRGKR